jgi:membrane protein DedA with SNARE-associated domain
MTLSLVGSVVWFITTVMLAIGLAGLVALIAIDSVGIPPLPGEVILTFAGFLVASGAFSFLAAVVAALAGAMIGSFVAYGIGRWGRHWIISPRMGVLRLDEKYLHRMETWFAGRGQEVVGIARNIPILRSYISYPAGTARMDPVRFGLYTLVGSIPFTLGFLYAGVVLKSRWSVITGYFAYLDILVVVLLVAVGVYFLLRWKNVVTPGWPPRRLHPAADSDSVPPKP